MDKVQHFEIPADDLARAKKFYQEAFGWKLTEFPEMEYTMAYTTDVDEHYMPKEPGVINGGIVKRNLIAPLPVIVITVNSLEDALKKIERSGGIVLSEVKKIGDMGLYVYVKDPEGNVIGVWESVRKEA